jgi:hypothetical protein
MTNPTCKHELPSQQTQHTNCHCHPNQRVRCFRGSVSSTAENNPLPAARASSFQGEVWQGFLGRWSAKHMDCGYDYLT